MTIPYEEPASIGRPFVDLGPEVAVAVLLTIQSGWRLVKDQALVSTSFSEVSITERLREAMRQVLNKGELPWGRTMIVAPGTESTSRAGLLRPDGLTDIPVYVISVFLATGSHDPHAIVECKRIAENDAGLVRQYVVEGIDRFASAKYAADHRIGFMVGYVVAGTGQGAVDRINALLDKQSRSAELLRGGPPVAGVDGVWLSEHPRARASSPISIQHTMAIIDGGSPVTLPHDEADRSPVEA